MTGAGKRLLEREALNARPFPLITEADIAAIESEAVAAFKEEMARTHTTVDDLAYEAGVEDEQARCKADMADVWREAVAAERARIRAAVEGLGHFRCEDSYYSCRASDDYPLGDIEAGDCDCYMSAVLAAIDGETT